MRDNEYTIMSEIAENEKLTQRELSKKLGVSVSTVNVLMNKMIKEGFIKMKQVSQKQALYMLTPSGMIEKAKKTVSYLKSHYRAIYQTKEKIKLTLEDLSQKNDIIFILKGKDEIGEIIEIAVDEYKSINNKSNIELIDKHKVINTKEYERTTLVHMAEEEDILKSYLVNTDLNVVNLSERI